MLLLHWNAVILASLFFFFLWENSSCLRYATRLLEVSGWPQAQHSHWLSKNKIEMITAALRLQQRRIGLACRTGWHAAFWLQTQHQVCLASKKFERPIFNALRNFSSQFSRFYTCMAEELIFHAFFPKLVSTSATLSLLTDASTWHLLATTYEILISNFLNVT